ncbi:unnamed protein product [Phytophthora fragariaefolia]|uniref:Unnamed protein product n=1 Tax=Phytophthora fragariaefolia TaxID=1490495 RepID=A0A9W6XY42_9STRA|nr:unnamed protein product [Phytophthora fragariaefolia]
MPLQGVEPDAGTPSKGKSAGVNKRVQLTDDEWMECVRQYRKNCPAEVHEHGTLADMRAVRKRAVKATKAFKLAKRVRRIQKKQAQAEQLKQRELQVAVGGGTSRLSTALLAFTRRHTQEVRLDSNAQFSVAGVALRKYGRCVSRKPPVDVVEGFGGGKTRVLGVWRITGTTQYQQRITVDALFVDGQDDAFLVGEYWMVSKQVKMHFATRELKYRDASGQKVILPFICHGVTSLQQDGEERKAVVRLAKAKRLCMNTQSALPVQVDAEDGTAGVFLPQPTSKRHLIVAPTVDIVRDSKVRVSVLNLDGKRVKLPARKVLGTWIPTDEAMLILSLNGELERARVTEWVATLSKESSH